MNKLLCFLFLVALSYSGSHALKCYQCNTENEDQCARAAKQMQCARPAPGYEAACYYRKGYDTYARKYQLTASCALVNQYTKAVAECQPNHYLQIYDCRVCQNDLCNNNFWDKYYG